MSTDNLSLLRAGKLHGIKRLDLSCDLTTFPPEIFELADSLEVLNLSQNQLSSLPDDLPHLSKLRVLFCSENQFRHVPNVLGKCPNLSMIGFKSNQIETIDDEAFPLALRWLILTDNRISELPATLGRCVQLQKLMLSGNQLAQLPDEMALCVNLELVRLAANRFETLPDWLFALPRLCWLAFAGNPCSPTPPSDQPSITKINWSDIELQEKLGEGASGIIYKGLWKSNSDAGAKPVAVKIFKGAVTSDGLPANEMAACLAAGSHEHLIEILGEIVQHPAGLHGLVMSLISPDFINLAGPPSLDSCTRDLYPSDRTFALSSVIQIAKSLASVALQLHQRGIFHGDFYAHNVLWNQQDVCLLGDFGAASFYDQAGRNAEAIPRLEVRAFGCLLEELLSRAVVREDEKATAQKVANLQTSCLAPDVNVRPDFSKILAALEKI